MLLLLLLPLLLPVLLMLLPLLLPLLLLLLPVCKLATACSCCEWAVCNACYGLLLLMMRLC